MLPAGETAVLLEVRGVDDVLALTRALRVAHLPGVVDLVPAALTVLVHGAAGTDLATLSSAVQDVAADADTTAVDTGRDDDILIRVRYDGPDLAEVARLTGSSRVDVIARHTGTVWWAAFVGFAPGFAYLTGGDPRLAVPRRAESRASVPAGAVALAGGFSAVYPQASPGGWQLIGSTDAVLWDLGRDPPALIQPGRRVRFVEITEITGIVESDHTATDLGGAW